MDKSDDSLSGPGDRVRRTRRQCPPASGGDDIDKSENFQNLIKKETPRRTLSGELESSLVISDKNWKTLDTVHKHKFDFDDSESLMDDSFAGASFASTTDSLVDDEDYARSRFTQLDDELPPSAASGGKSAPSPKKATPRRTYSKQGKRMPKKSDPLSAISEDDSGCVED